MLVRGDLYKSVVIGAKSLITGVEGDFFGGRQTEYIGWPGWDGLGFLAVRLVSNETTLPVAVARKDNGFVLYSDPNDHIFARLFSSSRNSFLNIGSRSEGNSKKRYRINNKLAGARAPTHIISST